MCFFCLSIYSIFPSVPFLSCSFSRFPLFLFYLFVSFTVSLFSTTNVYLLRSPFSVLYATEKADAVVVLDDALDVLDSPPASELTGSEVNVQPVEHSQ